MSLLSFEIKALVETERNLNDFTRFYTPPSPPKLPKKNDPPLNAVQSALRNYKHEDALNFACTSSLVWKKYTKDNFRQLYDYPAEIHCSTTSEKVRAYYRVIVEKSDGYIMAACHVNVHGLHRGDLRFVEVNNRTVTNGSEQYSCVGQLFLGDVVAVTGLARLKEWQELPVLSNTHDSHCIWMASNITVLPRTILENVVFSILQNGTAVVKEQSEVMNVQTTDSRVPLQVGKLYTATAFVPEKMTTFFTADHQQNKKNALILMCSKIHQYPNALGTIYEFKHSPELSRMFDIGTDAFKNNSYYGSSSEILETCVLMGYAAANSITNGRFDSRSFPMHNIERKGPVVQFSIDNPPEKPTEGKWTINSRIKISGNESSTNATIETVLLQQKMLRITARLSRDIPHHIKFNKGIHIVSQREAPDTQVLKTGFFNKIPRNSNGREILEVLYGGTPLTCPATQNSFFSTSIFPSWNQRKAFMFPGVKDKILLNQYQCDYVNMLLKKTPMVVGSSPFGCGKSMTIVTAALEIYKEYEPYLKADKNFKKKQLLVTQSNYASVNLVDISGKIQKEQAFKFVRYISEKNWKELADDCLTDYDLPKLMEREFLLWATGVQQHKDLQQKHMNSMLNMLISVKLLEVEDLDGQAFRAYHGDFTIEEPWRRDLLEAFFMLFDPDVIMTTADSLQALLSLKVLKPEEVVTIQIDEASQVPEYTFISLLTLFPDANYGLIGDIQQLPPYCETGLEGKLKDYGIGNTMERCVEDKLFPQAMLREVYRCHPKITNMLSELFYDGRLISGITEKDRSEFMTKRSDFWPGSQYPVLVVNNRERGYRMGTSCGNKSEVQIVKNILNILTSTYNKYQLQPSNIGVISFYAAQTSVLTEALRGKKVKCGTVDAFQGTERDVIILCCTNEKISEFMQLSNRINVAMSRAKQVTILVGNVGGLKNAKFWGTIVRKAEENGGVIEAASLDPTTANQPSSQNRQRNRHNKQNAWSQKPEEIPAPLPPQPIPNSKPKPTLVPPQNPHLADLIRQMDALKLSIANFNSRKQQQ